MSLLQPQVEKAVEAIVQLVQDKHSKPNVKGQTELITDEEYISVLIALKKIPKTRGLRPRRIPLVHSIYANASICVFAKDTQQEAKKLFEEKPVDGVKKVLAVTKLKKNFHQFDARRKLVNRFDLFLADDRIYAMLPRLLGKEFFRRKKNPVPIRLTRKNLAKEIAAARDSTYMFDFLGSCCAIRVGRTDQTPKEVAENVMAAVNKIVKQIPKQWDNVQSINIKSTSSLALPLYNSLPEVALVVDDTPRQRQKRTDKKKKKRKAGKKRKNETKEGEAKNEDNAEGEDDESEDSVYDSADDEVDAMDDDEVDEEDDEEGGEVVKVLAPEQVSKAPAKPSAVTTTPKGDKSQQKGGANGKQSPKSAQKKAESPAATEKAAPATKTSPAAKRTPAPQSPKAAAAPTKESVAVAEAKEGSKKRKAAAVTEKVATATKEAAPAPTQEAKQQPAKKAAVQQPAKGKQAASNNELAQEEQKEKGTEEKKGKAGPSQQKKPAQTPTNAKKQPAAKKRRASK